MKPLLFILMYVTVISESTIFPFPLSLGIFLILFSVFEDISVLPIFLLGILLDISTFRLLGVTSLFFLILLLIKNRYKEKLYTANIIYNLVFFFLAFFSYNYLFFQNLDFIKVLFSTIITLILVKLISGKSSDLVLRNKLTLQ